MYETLICIDIRTSMIPNIEVIEPFCVTFQRTHRGDRLFVSYLIYFPISICLLNYFT